SMTLQRVESTWRSPLTLKPDAIGVLKTQCLGVRCKCGENFACTVRAWSECSVQREGGSPPLAAGAAPPISLAVRNTQSPLLIAQCALSNAQTALCNAHF